MATKRAVREIAQALAFMASQEKCVKTVAAQLEAVAEALTENPNVMAALADRGVAIETRRQALQRALKNVAHPLLMNALLVLQDAGELRQVRAFQSVFASEAERLASHRDGRVRSAAPLTPSERASLEKALVSKFGGTLHLREHLDPSLLAGFVVDVGDWRFDASLAGRIQRLKHTLSAPNTF